MAQAVFVSIFVIQATGSAIWGGVSCVFTLFLMMNMEESNKRLDKIIKLLKDDTRT